MFDKLKEDLKKPPTLEVLLEMFYAQEQNVSLSSSWDAGWDVIIGYQPYEIKAANNCESIEIATKWLWEKYQELYSDKK